MGLNSGIILSDDCADSYFIQVENIFGISLKEVKNPSIQHQLNNNCTFYLLGDDSSDSFWDNWIPIGRGNWMEEAKNKIYDDFKDIFQMNAVQFAIRYTSFEAQMYVNIIKYIRITCNVNCVGLVGFVKEGNDFIFPKLKESEVKIKNLNVDTIYKMNENCIYYFY